MEKLTPISESNFDIHVKRDMGVTIDFKRFFQEYIDKIPDFAIGPSFWLIPDQINMSFYSVSDNIHLFTPLQSRNGLEIQYNFGWKTFIQMIEIFFLLPLIFPFSCIQQTIM